MQPYFAERSASEELQAQIDKAGANPIIAEMMRAVDGLAAVLNRRRQVLAINERLLASFDIDNPREMIGLSPGKVLESVSAHETADGCAIEECPSCAAAVASVIGQAMDRPVERICSLSASSRGEIRDYYFRVHAAPFDLGQERYILLFLHDATHHQQLEALERVFFHDINNTLSSLVAASELLMNATAGEFAHLAPAIRRLSNRMAQEVSMQRHLIQRYYGNCELYKQSIQVKSLIDELIEMMSYHPAAAGKPLDIDSTVGHAEIVTAPAIVLRVLSNMLVNAFEATRGSEAVGFSAHFQKGMIVFEVWNREFIPSQTSRQIFQRNYSTKGEIGRGLGTFSMKLFGEKILGGKISFTTHPEEGTTFRFALPIKTRQPCENES